MSNSKIKDFMFSEEGFDVLFDFRNHFDCVIGILEPGYDITLEVEDRTYFIPDDYDVDAFKDLISRSYQENKNLIYETFKENVFETIPGVDY